MRILEHLVITCICIVRRLLTWHGGESITQVRRAGVLVVCGDKQGETHGASQSIRGQSKDLVRILLLIYRISVDHLKSLRERETVDLGIQLAGELH